jgi:FOG: WD40-like repeat
MQTNKIRKNLSIGVISILLISTLIVLLPFATSHTPPLDIATYSFCSVSPNPVGLGQTANVNFWVNIPPPTASGQYGDRWQNMTVVVKKPDGTLQTLGSFKSDATGGSHTTFTPSAQGNYTFQMFFGGQTITGENLAPGDSPDNYATVGDYYLPSSSNVFTLMVQQDTVGYSAMAPLPSSYWERPIYGENNNWYTIGGNWLGTAQTAFDFAITGAYGNEEGNYNPYTQAPNTAHILWTKPEAFGGIIGGTYGNSQTSNYYSTSNYEPKFAPIIINGILYYTKYPGSVSNPAGWEAVDLHTGKTLWTKNTTDLLYCGQILNYQSPNQYGGLAYLWSIPSPDIVAYGGGFGFISDSMSMWDAMTGNYILTITNTPAMGAGIMLTDNSGGLAYYYVNSTDNTINLWNSTRCINLAVPNSYDYATGAPIADNWMWRPTQNATIDFDLGIQWTKPLADNISGTPIVDYMNGLNGLSLYGINSGVMLFTETQAGQAWGYSTGWAIEAGYSQETGQQLWITNRTLPPYSLNVVGSCGLYGWTMSDGIYCEVTQSNFEVNGYSLTTGQKLWGPVTLPDANPYSSLGVSCQVANGTLYVYTYGGDVYSLDMHTGKVNWAYHSRTANLDSPYGIWPLWPFGLSTVADGKIYVPEGHEYSPPLFHGAQQLAINTTDGKLVWSIDAFDVTNTPAISDGVMVTLNAYDNQIYGYGKGASRLTVTAPSIGVTTATPITISGTITDISAGASQQAVAANYPNGLPCVSDDSMSGFMEAVYMQQQMPNNVTGVPLTISVIDANGNYRTIGTTTSDASGTFAFNWTPDISGAYTVYATFAGSESYYSSNAAAHFYAAESPATATPQPTQAPSAADLYFLPAIAGLFVAIIICIVMVALVLRKHP